MRKLILLIVVALAMTGCVAYPGYYGYYDSGYYGYPYGYTGTSVNLHFQGGHHGYYGGHHGYYGKHHGYYGGHHGSYGRGWHR